MRALLLDEPRRPLRLADVARPVPTADQIRVRVHACGVCRTDLHVVDAELDKPKLPLVLGHQIVGVVDDVGANVRGFSIGERVGVPWLGGVCGVCRYCSMSRENLCDDAVFTGYNRDGGYAEYAVAHANFCFRISGPLDDAESAPLLCAGLIGYRSLRLAGDAERLGIYGFGAAAHIVTQIARWEGRRVFAFTRPGDEAAQGLASRLGAEWAGASNEPAPTELDAAIVFASAGELIPIALRSLSKGGKVVCGGIHMSDIPTFPYSSLWGERSIQSVANLTRNDGREFFEIAPKIPIRTEVTRYPLERGQEALDDLRNGRFSGAAVLVI